MLFRTPFPKSAWLSLVLLFALTTYGWAQLDYRYTQFYQNPLPVNPAFSGIEDFVDVKVGYRTQWAGFDNSPTAMFASGNLAFKISGNNKYKHRGVRLFEAEAYNSIENDDDFGYRKSKRHGLGVYVMQNSDGGFENTGAFINYAYHINLTNQLVWSVGAGVGYELNRFNLNGISVLNPDLDATYQAYLRNDSQKSSANVNLGTVIYHKQFYLGYSVLNATKIIIPGNNDSFNNLVNPLTHNIQFGFHYRKWRYGYLVSPYLMINMRKNQPVEVIGALRVRYHDKVWGGIQYTLLGAVGVSAGFYLTPNIGLNYGYEFPTSKISRVSTGTHELILSFKLKNRNFSRAYLY